MNKNQPIVGEYLDEVISHMRMSPQSKDALVAICTRADNKRGIFSSPAESTSTSSREGSQLMSALRSHTGNVYDGITFLKEHLSREIYFDNGEIHFSAYISQEAVAA